MTNSEYMMRITNRDRRKWLSTITHVGPIEKGLVLLLIIAVVVFIMATHGGSIHG
jgi:hypothetical protein